MVPLAKLPEYLKFNAYKCPSDSRNGPVQYAFGTSKPTWEYWESIPGVMENFNTFMSGVRGATASWVKWFPIKERLINGAKGGDKEVFMIDVGGGRGHNLLEVKTKFPEAGRYILQDLPSVVEDVGDLDKDIERMGIDMFEAQPVKGLDFPRRDTSAPCRSLHRTSADCQARFPRLLLPLRLPRLVR